MTTNPGPVTDADVWRGLMLGFVAGTVLWVGLVLLFV
jgi:hypothetical protein